MGCFKNVPRCHILPSKVIQNIHHWTEKIMRFFNHHFHKIKESFKIIIVIIFLLSSSRMNNFFNLFFEFFFLWFKRRLKICKLKLTIFTRLLTWKMLVTIKLLFVTNIDVNVVAEKYRWKIIEHLRLFFWFIFDTSFPCLKLI